MSPFLNDIIIKMNKNYKKTRYIVIFFNDHNTLSNKSSVVVKFICFARLVQRLTVRLMVFLASDSAPLYVFTLVHLWIVYMSRCGTEWSKDHFFRKWVFCINRIYSRSWSWEIKKISENRILKLIYSVLKIRPKQNGRFVSEQSGLCT